MQNIGIQEQRKRTTMLIIGQMIGFVFGLVFVLTDKGYSGFEFAFAIIGAPLGIAGMIRVGILTYRFAKRITAQKFYDAQGDCIGLVPRKGLSLTIGIISGIGSLFAVVGIGSIAPIIRYIILPLVLILEAYLLIKDFMFLINSAKSTAEDSI